MKENVNESQAPRLDEKRLLNIGDLCKYLSMGRTKAFYLAKEQGFEVRVGARVLYDRLKVDQWVDEQSMYSR